MRRLPVYILIDCSESMAGEPMVAVQKGLEAMLKKLKTDPYALETVYMSIITFSARAKQIVPLTEVAQFNIPPKLSIKPGTAMGAALRLLAERMRVEIRKTTPDQKGDFKPIVFLLTDGQPTDAWEDAAAALKSVHPKIANIYAIGCGEDVDFNVLSEVTDIAYHMKDVTSDMIAKFFVWMSASVQAMSQGADAPLSLEKSPFQDGGFDVIDPDNLPYRSDVPLQIFLHSRCISTRKFYMMRYTFIQEHSVYLAKSAHAVPEDFFSEGAAAPPAISSDLLYGAVPCPHCGNEAWGQCGACGQIFCGSESPPPQVQCPSCMAVLQMGDGGSFDVTRSSG